MISIPFTIAQKLPEKQHRTFPAALVYTEKSPYEVLLALQPPEMDGEIVNWSFSRELLLSGSARTQPYGDGAVRFHQCSPGKAVHIELDGCDPEAPDEYGSAVLHVPFEVITGFLRQSFLLVPRGQELRHCDWDAEIALLVGNPES